MRYFDNEENDLLNEMDELLSSDIAPETKEETKVEETEEEGIVIPLDYQVFTTNNGEVTGKRELIDTLMCDRKKGIVPIGKARMKADRLKEAFKNKVYFVVENSSKILANGKVITVEKIVYKTK